MKHFFQLTRKLIAYLLFALLTNSLTAYFVASIVMEKCAQDQVKAMMEFFSIIEQRDD
jgi:phage shock protein PspC (stress-responsive transcriptional regulator)